MNDPEIDERAARALLTYAERLLDQVVARDIGIGAAGRDVIVPPAEIEAILRRRYGAFSTLKVEGKLRGCIGNFAGSAQLGEVLPRVVAESALHDRRFPPVRNQELETIDLSLSILYPAYSVSGPDEIKLGRDGVILSRNGHRAVFLPEVAVEQGWDLATMLSALSRKAGLALDAWRLDGAEFEVFQTTHISWGAPGSADQRVRIEGGHDGA